MYRNKVKSVHFVGIGGIGMSGIAEVLLNMGFQVSGSDLKSSEITERLKALGATLYLGHSKENIGTADVVVYSSAVAMDNPELQAALERHIPVIPRAEMLAELMRMKYGIAVAGTHGKTTTTSMIATITSHSGIDPTVVIGGRLNSFGSNAKLGRGDFLVAEADESDRSFLGLSPVIAVVTNIDPEHMDQYRDIEDVKGAYLSFINSIPFYGLSVLNLDHPNLKALLPEVKRRYITYGKSAHADIQATGIERKGMYTSFNCSFKGKTLGGINLPLPGEYNVYNALAAVAVGIELDIGFEEIKEALEGFSGVQRRFEIKGVVNGIMVVDDYGHHPVEVKAVLRAAKDGWNKRTIVAFQPHRYTRTRDLYQDFLSAFYDADKLIITDIYPVGEEPIAGVDASRLYQGIKDFGHKDAIYIKNKYDIVDWLLDNTLPGDMVITLGAGDIWQVGDEFIDRLERKGIASRKV